LLLLYFPFDPLKRLQTQALPLLETVRETQRNSNIDDSDTSELRM